LQAFPLFFPFVRQSRAGILGIHLALNVSLTPSSNLPRTRVKRTEAARWNIN